MDTNVEASVVINKLTSQIAQLSYDNAVLQAVNERNQEILGARDGSAPEEPVHIITNLD